MTRTAVVLTSAKSAITFVHLTGWSATTPASTHGKITVISRISYALCIRATTTFASCHAYRITCTFWVITTIAGAICRNGEFGVFVGTQR